MHLVAIVAVLNSLPSPIEMSTERHSNRGRRQGKESMLDYRYEYERSRAFGSNVMGLRGV